MNRPKSSMQSSITALGTKISKTFGLVLTLPNAEMNHFYVALWLNFLHEPLW